MSYSKEEQIGRSHRRDGAYWCGRTGLAKRVCRCSSCVAKRNRRLGKRKQGEERKKLEKHFGQAGKYASQTGNEETWRMRVRAEVKSGKQVDPIGTRFLAAEGQSGASTAIGDLRPFVFLVRPQNMDPEGLVIFRSSELAKVLEALNE